MKERYINNKLSKIKNKITDTKKIKDIVDTLSKLGILELSIFTFSGLLFFKELGIAALIGLLACTSANIRYNKIYEDILEKLTKEQEHIEKIKENTPEANTNLNKKRVNKIKALKQNKKEIEKKYNISKHTNELIAVAEISGAALTFINPLFSIMGFCGVGCNIINSINMAKQSKKLTNIDNRINNIQNDLQVIMNDEKDKQEKRIRTRKIMKPEENQNNKNNNKIIDDYVENLSDWAEENELTEKKQKVKK